MHDLDDRSVSDRGIEGLRLDVRRQALGNLLLVLLREAGRSGGRFGVRPLGPDAIELVYPGVYTLVREDGVFRRARRDFAVVLGLPLDWPFTRDAEPRIFVVQPRDWAHPNSDGTGVCLDLKGVLPERIPALIHDDLRIRRFSLDDAVDRRAADHVRAHLAELRADGEPLYPAPTGAGAAGTEAAAGSEACAVAAEALGQAPETAAPDATPPPEDGPPDGAVDVATGAFDVALPPVTPPVTLRLARAAGDPLDQAWRTFLALAAPRVRTGRCVWAGGPALQVDPPAPDPDRMRRELWVLGQGIRALADPPIARRYVELNGTRSSPT